ncbi:MAG: hypothetical protein C0504_09270 [Candidatus Solibacter sp.]|nr:hypothetical protein [Candidatus Solibacter sp.]
MPDQVYVHRAVLVPGNKGGKVYASLGEAPAKVRRVFENGSVVTIIIADRAAQARVDRPARQPRRGRDTDASAGLVWEVVTAVALIGAVFYFAVSR